MSSNGKEFPGRDHLRILEQVARELSQTTESIYWQVEAFRGRIRAVAGRKILDCIQSCNWQTVAELLTIDSRYMHADQNQQPRRTIHRDTPVCDTINQLVSQHFVMIVERKECVEYLHTKAKTEGRLHLSTPCFNLPEQHDTANL